MKRAAVAAMFLACASTIGFAQQPQPGSDGLTDQQRLGRRVFAQSCGVCHLRPAYKVQTYGPMLNRNSAGGDPVRMRNAILDGTTRMPAFKYYLQGSEVDAIVAYLKTVAPQAQAQTPGPAS